MSLTIPDIASNLLSSFTIGKIVHSLYLLNMYNCLVTIFLSSKTSLQRLLYSSDIKLSNISLVFNPIKFSFFYYVSLRKTY